jgi:hypothetical protein
VDRDSLRALWPYHLAHPTALRGARPSAGIERLRDEKETIMTASPTLPQRDDLDAEGRRQRLYDTRQQYKYDRDYLAPLVDAVHSPTRGHPAPRRM